jgi:hypothetical protein
MCECIHVSLCVSRDVCWKNFTAARIWFSCWFCLTTECRCADGHCYSEQARCATSRCTATDNEAFVCVAGKEQAPHCVSSPLACLRKAEALEQCGERGCCWDGTAQQANATCGPVPACAPLRLRCGDGRCRDALLEHACADDADRDAPLLAAAGCAANLTRCADGRCYATPPSSSSSSSSVSSVSACSQVPHEACAIGEVLCWSGTCVNDWQQCADTCPFVSFCSGALLCTQQFLNVAFLAMR